jgi:sugar lactone lactonase YvrE
MRQYMTHALLTVLAAGCGYDRSPVPYDLPNALPTESLWVASGSDPALLRFAREQLLASGSKTASATITTSSATLFTINGIAFDTAGTMWVASADDSLLIAFSAAALATSGFTAASRIITPNDESLSSPSAIAFDPHHRLWVANAETGTLARFDPTQFATSGALEPAHVIRGPTRPSALAFDASGSLWVANIRTNNIARYSAAQLADSGFVTPAVVLRPLGKEFTNPSALAFDAAGTLWVSYIGGATIAGFSPNQLSASGTSAPHITISLAGSFGLPAGLAFDADGNLWVVSAEGALHRFAASALLASGSPSPSEELLVHGHTLLSGIAFWPKPRRLPLN